MLSNEVRKISSPFHVQDQHERTVASIVATLGALTQRRGQLTRQLHLMEPLAQALQLLAEDG